MTPTVHLRFVEMDMPEPHPTVSGVSAIKRVKVLQQFWETNNGNDVVEDMFTKTYGIWKNVPMVMKND
jgi:hypothetical protein